MDPVTAAAAIGALASLTSGLFGADVAKKKEERDRQMQALQMQQQAGQQAAQTMGNQSPFQALMQSYQNILGR